MNNTKLKCEYPVREWSYSKLGVHGLWQGRFGKETLFSLRPHSLAFTRPVDFCSCSDLSTQAK